MDLIPISDWAAKRRPDLSVKSATAMANRFAKDGKLKGAKLKKVGLRLVYFVPEDVPWPKYQKKGALCAKCGKEIAKAS